MKATVDGVTLTKYNKQFPKMIIIHLVINTIEMRSFWHGINCGKIRELDAAPRFAWPPKNDRFHLKFPSKTRELWWVTICNELPDSSVDKTLTAKRAVENDFGRAYCTDKCEMRSTVKACLSMSDCRSNSGAKSKHMCMEGTPLTVIGSRSRGYP